MRTVCGSEFQTEWWCWKPESTPA